MSEKNTLVRSLHDIGLAAWFGGSLMGAVGLNGAAAQASDPVERLQLSSAGWARWVPLNAAAIAAHMVGGLGLIAANRGRVATQPGARSNTLAKAALTTVAVGLTAYSGKLGREVDDHSAEGGEGPTEPHDAASPELEAAQQRLRLIQWTIPAVTGVLVVLAAQQGEQQRPQSLLRSQMARLHA